MGLIKKWTDDNLYCLSISQVCEICELGSLYRLHKDSDKPYHTSHWEYSQKTSRCGMPKAIQRLHALGIKPPDS